MSNSDLAERIGAVDSGDQLDAALSLPDYLRDALWRVVRGEDRAVRVDRAPRLRDGRLGDRRRPRRRRARLAALASRST